MKNYRKVMFLGNDFDSKIELSKLILEDEVQKGKTIGFGIYHKNIERRGKIIELLCYICTCDPMFSTSVHFYSKNSHVLFFVYSSDIHDSYESLRPFILDPNFTKNGSLLTIINIVQNVNNTPDSNGIKIANQIGARYFLLENDDLPNFRNELLDIILCSDEII